MNKYRSAFHENDDMLFVAIGNSYILFKESQQEEKQNCLTLKLFRRELIAQLIPEPESDEVRSRSREGNDIFNNELKPTPHLLKKIRSRWCVVCYIRKFRKKRRNDETTFCCDTCPSKPATPHIPDCFHVHHKKLMEMWMKQKIEFEKTAKWKPTLPPISFLFSNFPLFYFVFLQGPKKLGSGWPFYEY